MTLIEAHRFFVRESQHYMLGNWYVYAKADPKKRAIVRRFLLRWPVSYTKFMSFFLWDEARAFIAAQRMRRR